VRKKSWDGLAFSCERCAPFVRKEICARSSTIEDKRLVGAKQRRQHAPSAPAWLQLVAVLQEATT
jgi:hypothetical protein